MSEPFELRALSAGDILERTITLIRLTFSRIGIIFVFLALPAAILFGVVMDGFLSSVLAAASSGGGPDSIPVFLLSILKWVVIIAAAALIMVIVELIALISMQIIVCGEIVGRYIDVREAVELTMGFRLWRAIVQRILAELLIGLIVAVPYLAVVLAVTADAGAVSIVAIMLAVLLAILGLVYLRVRWAFGTTTIAWEDQTILGAFSRSSELVRGQWLRTFLILALFAIVVGLLMSMLLTPIQLLAFKDLFLAGLDQARTVALQSQPEMVEALSGIGFWYGISIALASLGTTLVKSVYLSVLYFDLRVRSGEFESE